MRSTRTETLCLESFAKGDALQASSEGALNHQSGRGRMHAPLGHNRPLADPIRCLKMAVNDRWRGGQEVFVLVVPEGACVRITTGGVK